MTSDEWKALAIYVDCWWPATEFTEAYEKAYFVILEPFPAQDVETAVRARLEVGSPFAPSCAELLLTLRQMQAAGGGGLEGPAFGVVLAAVQEATKRWPDNERIALHWLATKHEWISQWASEYGWRVLTAEHLDEGSEFYGATRHRVEKSWDRFCESMVEGERAERAQELIGESPIVGELRKMSAPQIEAAS